MRGKGTPDSFESCSRSADREMSYGEAKRLVALADHRAPTEGAESRKDKDLIDETPARPARTDRCHDAGAARAGRRGAHVEAGCLRRELKAVGAQGVCARGGTPAFCHPGGQDPWGAPEALRT